MSDRVVEVLQAMGLGLSRLIRYAYPGFLLIFIASIVNAPMTGQIIKALTPQVAMITAVIIGAGLYATHRGLIIPVHHFFLCVAFYVYEKIRCIPAEKTVSPTRWLGEIVGVAFGRRILSYSALRHGDFFGDKESCRLNVAHAESGLVVMTAEGLLAAALYANAFPDKTSVAPEVLFILSGLFLIASYFWPWAQHSSECLRMKKKEAEVRQTLCNEGLLDDSKERMPKQESSTQQEN